MDDLRIERILRAVECVPAGSVVTYGLIGRVVGEAPRAVGRVMGLWSSGLPWWRVVNVSGTVPGHEEEAVQHWLQEGTVAPGQHRVRVSASQMPEDALRRLWEQKVADLSPEE